MNRCHTGMQYLASPLTHPDPAVQKVRHEAAVIATAKLFDRGIWAISPIVHSCALLPHIQDKDKVDSFERWEKYDTELLTSCTGMIVLMLDGWQQSKGVTAELEIAKKWLIPVSWLSYPDMVLSESKLQTRESTASDAAFSPEHFRLMDLEEGLLLNRQKRFDIQATGSDPDSLVKLNLLRENSALGLELAGQVAQAAKTIQGMIESQFKTDDDNYERVKRGFSAER